MKARTAAEELAADLMNRAKLVPKDYTFKRFAHLFLEKGRRLVETGERNANYMRTARLFLDNDEWGLLRRFGHLDVREMTTRDFNAFMIDLEAKRSDLSPSTRNMLTATFRNVLKVARDTGVIDEVPDTPRRRQKDNPRPFFRFYPLVPKERDAYKALLRSAKEMAEQGEEIRGVAVAEELYDLILFVTHSFVRPISTELYALRHADVEVAENPKRLLLTVRNGKTGYRHSNSMPAAVAVYKRICQRNPNHRPEDFLFFPDYPNRATASRIVQRQFNAALERAALKTDPFTGMSTRSTRCGTRRSACGLSCRRARSTSSTSPRTPGPASSRSSGSTPATSHSAPRWPETCKSSGGRQSRHNGALDSPRDLVLSLENDEEPKIRACATRGRES